MTNKPRARCTFLQVRLQDADRDLPDLIWAAAQSESLSSSAWIRRALRRQLDTDATLSTAYRVIGQAAANIQSQSHQTAHVCRIPLSLLVRGTIEDGEEWTCECGRVYRADVDQRGCPVWS